MKAELVNHKTTKKYQYISLLVADQKLFDYELVKIWNSGVDCKKAGSAVSVLLRKAL
jgi:hypothetical protein